MRLSSERIAEITHLTQKSAQKKWFFQHLGVAVPTDRFGPILTDTIFEKLLEKRLGIGASLATEDKPRPKLRS